MNILNNTKRHLNTFSVLMLFAFSLLVTAGCSVQNSDGTVTNEIPLPTDSTINFYCADEGIFDNKCVLDDPENPYAKVLINEVTKFELNDSAPSAKARFYLWATAQARNSFGENQYYTALSLQEVYAESGSPTTRNQAINAYRSVLDNYFLSSTFFVVTVDGEEVAFAASLKDIVGGNLYDPTAANLVSLYTDPVFALEAMSEWGYIYDTTNLITTIIR